MFEFAGLLYEMFKDIKDHLKFDEEDKLVSSAWLEESGFLTTAKNNGCALRWSLPENISTRELDGYEVLIEVDKIKRKHCRLVRKDGTILIGKRT